MVLRNALRVRASTAFKFQPFIPLNKKLSISKASGTTEEVLEGVAFEVGEVVRPDRAIGGIEAAKPWSSCLKKRLLTYTPLIGKF